MSRRAGLGVVAFAAALLIGYVAWEWYLSPEARVKRALEAAAAAAEIADADAFLELFSPDYSDFLHPDRGRLEARVRESFGRVDRLNVSLQSPEVQVSGQEARTTVGVVIVAIRGEERYVVLGTPFQPEKLEALLRREGGAWKIHRVDREPEP